ncbi:hypothetical protein SAMN05660653_00965 [Desulfonatronum thiosulfatophilum]|uniref:Uncharacterized protein n=1 Tax=Desulfonatronum thiosulfatophilum TaxID=617002 RepID=A0A1G6BIE2_9BACT|nr:hypothetical protein [Desulfonatronum thiosulfatophilum]SDB20363.1 hypothetical protein SAMN05660653_00965 [Desulfonatronum thiosulfatophilum]
MKFKRTLLLMFLLLLPPMHLVASGRDVLAVPVVPSHVEQQFSDFSHKWIDKIDRNFASRIGKMEIIPHSGGYLARYMQIDRDSISWSVKTISGSPLNYIGLLEYVEWTYECMAPTREAVEQGPFVRVRGRQVTEIFQYDKNKWLE